MALFAASRAGVTVSPTQPEQWEGPVRCVLCGAVVVAYAKATMHETERAARLVRGQDTTV
jgi:hypothetical protein